MRRFIWPAVALVALTAAGLAVAHGGVKAAKEVSATFTATGVSAADKTSTCTTGTDTIEFTKGTYTGSASGDADLTGPMKLEVRSVINKKNTADTSDDIGIVSGKLRIDTASGEDTVARFDAVYKAGKINGLAIGHAQDPHSRLIANLSASFGPSVGFSTGKIGNTDAGGAAVELTAGECKPAQAENKAFRSAEGTVTAASSSSITVRDKKGDLTCDVGNTLAAQVTALSVNNDKVEIRCAFVDGHYLLVTVEKKDKH